ncbi:hypothetical protein BVI2075_230194 [Burkholderia vietnamiensis]|nr:hypothetical protein BVI2075_230194 [Burkholderia vietnamiensis]
MAGNFVRTSQNACDPFKTEELSVIISFFRGVAQPGSVPAWGAGGRRFKSSRPDQESRPYKQCL